MELSKKGKFMLKSKKPRARGFTLAEIMIVLTVIGVLSAILLPVAINSTPDKNILKFKKANNTLATAIRSMISSGQYYTVGDLGRYPDGTRITDIYYDTSSGTTVTTGYTQEETEQYFFNSFANIVSVKELSLDWSSTGSGEEAHCSNKMSVAQFKAGFDTACSTYQNDTNIKKNILTTTDNITFYQISRQRSFARSWYGSTYGGGGVPVYTGLHVYYPDPFDYSELAATTCAHNASETLKFDASYKLFCIDIDGANGPIKPFGYGIRRDGKIATGARADWWLEREITKKETDCCPATLNSRGLCDSGDTVCGS